MRMESETHPPPPVADPIDGATNADTRARARAHAAYCLGGLAGWLIGRCRSDAG